MKRLLTILVACVVWWVPPSPAGEALKYEWTRHLDGPESCQPLINTTGRYHEWVDCVADKLPPLDPNRRSEFGQFYDPEKWRTCRHDTKPPVVSCEELRLRRRPEPEYRSSGTPTTTIAWPAPPKTSVYRPGMTPRQYFDALCATEAGEFIYRTVENVEGIYQIRPRIIPTDMELQDRYVVSDPLGAVASGGLGDSARRFVSTNRYLFVERPNVYQSHSRTHVGEYLRQFRPDPRTSSAGRSDYRPEGTNTLRSRYGYTWRGITRVHDREMGIAGGEFAVVDLGTLEVLAIRRGFAMTGAARNSPTRIWWLGAFHCPNLGERPEYAEVHFVMRVLRPVSADTGESK